MERKAATGIMLILLLISMLTLAPLIQLTLSEPETMLYIDPSETKVFVGNTFIIHVNLADVIDLYGYDIWLSYNTTFLDVISVDPPHLLPEPMIEIIEPDGIIHIYKILSPPGYC